MSLWSGWEMTNGAQKKNDAAGKVSSKEEVDYKHLLEVVKATARENPRLIANVIVEWLKND
jgi:flagellar biosynthesis/type III secretory pathway M-ring protein FliF/YscJ